MPKKEVLEVCEKTIRKDLGSLDDIPYELANTVANVYYRYFTQKIDIMKQARNNPGWIPKEMKRETDMLAGLNSFIENTARFNSDFEAATEFIKALREIDKNQQPNLYQYTVDFILDCLKYDIKNPENKTGFRRMIERKLKKKKIKEIPNLIDLLGLYQRQQTNIEEIGANLVAFAIDPDDIALCLKNLPQNLRIDDTTVENELRCLRVFAVDFAITLTLGKSGLKKQAVSNAYLALLQEILEKLPNNLGEQVLEMVIDRVDKYVDVLRKSPNEDPCLVIGHVFSKLCGDEDNIHLASFGKQIFVTTSNGAVEYLTSITV